MYYLLPFRFHVFRDQELLTNDLGDYLLVPRGSVQRIVDREVLSEEELYKDLVASFFISEKPLPRLIDTMAVRLATRKAFLDHFTALHIFVLTLRCNQNCIYCQASSQVSFRNAYDMSEQTLLHAVDLMFCSPSPSLTMEFQGGEPTLVPHLIRRAIEYAEEKNRTENREITYVVCTNSVNLTDELLDLCKRSGAVISTSRDGPQFLHDHNRGKTDSYQRVVAGITKAREELGEGRVSALLTTSVLIGETDFTVSSFGRSILTDWRKTMPIGLLITIVSLNFTNRRWIISSNSINLARCSSRSLQR